MSTVVMKFGGQAVSTTAALSQVLSIVLHAHTRGDRLLLVVSALEGVTDALVEAAQHAQMGNQRGYRRIAATMRTRHLALVEGLPLNGQERQALQAVMDRLLADMLDHCQTLTNHPDAPPPGLRASMIGVGERLAARMVAALLRQRGLRGVALDSTDLIVTDAVTDNATPDLNASCARIAANLLPMLERAIVPVVTGFIGATPDGTPTTLGRGGSDYTATVVGICAAADEVVLWTDVDGIMTTDPRDLANARVVPQMSYGEVAELAFFGARVLHPRMVGPLREHRVPLHIRSVYKPQQQGTLVGDRAMLPNTPSVRAVAHIGGVALRAQVSGSLEAASAQLDRAMRAVTGLAPDVTLSAQSASHSFVSCVVPTSAGPEAVLSVQQWLRDHPPPAGWQAFPVTMLTFIGARLGSTPALMGAALASLDGVPLLALSQAPSGHSLSVVLEVHHTEQALRQAHQFVLDGVPGRPTTG